MSSSIRLIAGLANPGNEYAKTRHNAGGWFVELLAQLSNAPLRHDGKLHAIQATFKQDKHQCQLLIPSLYMNESGLALKAYSHFYKIPPENILVAHDDIDLPVGNVRLKFDGGDGGHNGLKDIIRHLHTKQFFRLRIGVGRPKQSVDVVDYVLKAPSKSEKMIIEEKLQYVATDILPLILNNEINKAMQLLHTEK